MSRRDVEKLFLYTWSAVGFPDLRDREIWTEDLLIQEFDLSKKDAQDLHLALGNNCDRTIYGTSDEDAVKLLHNIQEAIHMSGSAFEGYSEEDSFAIHMFLSDMAYCMELEEHDDRELNPDRFKDERT